MAKKLKLSVSLILMLGIASPIWAQSPQPFPDFSAKRLKPPKPGATKRIHVQVEDRPNPAVPPLPVTATETDQETNALVALAPQVAKPVSKYTWFWDKVLPNATEIGPGRLQDALEVLAANTGRSDLSAPRLDDLQAIVADHGIDLLLNSVGTDISPAFALAVIYVESSGRVDATSGAGAQGLMQLIPATADRFGVDAPLDPAQNIKGGIAFLDHLMKTFSGDPVLVLAGYNAGENAVKENQGVPPYPETRNYVPKVLTAFNVAKGLCVTPPYFVSDGCVFASLSR
jgi:soluble lytic murein transglycosylase-like protein